MTDTSCAIPLAPAPGKPGFKAAFGSYPVNGQALSLFRIFLSLLLFYDLFAHILPTWDFFMTPYGTMSAAERNTTMVWSLLTYTDNIWYQKAFLGLYITSIFCFMIGFRTRLFCFFTLIGYASIVDRNMINASNVEVLIRALLLWSCFLPMDRFWSVAAALRGEENRNQTWPAIPIAAMKIQIIIVYLYSGLFKLGSDDWMSGNAIRYAVSDTFFGTELGRYIAQFTPDFVWAPLCWGVILFQLCFSFLIYSPYRNDVLRGVVLVLAVCMHLGFLILLQVGIFPYLCLVYLLLLVPDRWIDALLQKRRERFAKIRIYYDPDCGFCQKIANLLREFCLGPTTPVRPASDNDAALALLRSTNSWVVYGNDGKTYLKWDAVAYVLKQSPIFWIFGTISGTKILAKPMEKLYDMIGRNRHTLGTRFRFFLKAEAEAWPSLFAQYFCLLCLTILIVFNTSVLPQVKAPIQLKVSTAAHYLGVIQTWDLFAPVVPRWTWKFDVKAIDEEGNPVDISPWLTPQYSIDKYGFYRFAGHRMVKFYSRTFEPEEQSNRGGLARYLCYYTRKTGHPAEEIIMDHWRSHNYAPTWTVYKYHSNFPCWELLDPLDKLYPQFSVR